jgi:hypothetical protein
MVEWNIEIDPQQHAATVQVELADQFHIDLDA